MRKRIISFLGLTMLAAACAAPEGTSEEALTAAAPHLLALSTYSASLGTPVDVFIQNAPQDTARKFELVFDGTFKRSDGKEEKVNITEKVSRTEAAALRWTSFGPFVQPFTPTNPDIGVYTGTVGVKVTNQDGSVSMDPSPLKISFEVKPSIMITELQPTTAACDKPALRLIGGMPYKMSAKTIGFEGVSFEYAIKTPRMALDASGKPTLDYQTDGSPAYRETLVAHATGDTSKGPDKIKDNEAITIPPVPADRPSYGVIFTVTARDAKNATIKTAFGMTAHNPLEVQQSGTVSLAQIYPAEPVSSCMPGAQQGRVVQYQETKAESRKRSYTVTLASNWAKSEDNSWSTTDGKTYTSSTTKTESFERTHGTSNTFTFEKNGSHTWGWSDTSGTTQTVGGNVEIAAEVFGVGAKGGGKYDYATKSEHTNDDHQTEGWSQSNSNTTSDSESHGESTATTDSTAVSKSDTKGGSEGSTEGGGKQDADQWEVSTTDTIGKGFGGSIIAGTYGVFYRQMARYTTRVNVVEYTKCGEEEIVGAATYQDYIWAPDLALSNSCPPLPKSNFPAPQCVLPPCDE